MLGVAGLGLRLLRRHNEPWRVAEIFFGITYTTFLSLKKFLVVI
jgi:hypothetical protein